ncbi:SAC3/GANP/Nin1/mts3/eIF-3 p25 family-domain-containing protein [Aspergillus avenaceus]|uniref:SAC3/GANP/Nin1/mts3/eIF-3 p25 family-domain-containing protein n=1 Tax=Aspergillus avenaceus TaxID=36643 RepID=A0A5N6TWS9_ASPAV|nr:SAC3/GANP/Nin1/mts3/eIF-3 p25 family-domain-containing protein [Aspergillus avenaceus]
MTGPPNPFAGLGQKDGSIVSSGRGRGGQSGRSRPYHGKNADTPRDPNMRGRGRGASMATRSTRGHGRGGGAAGNVWRKPETNAASSGPSVSPFAQLKQNQSTTTPFGARSVPHNSSYSGPGKASPFQATPNLDGTQIDSTRDPRKRPSKFTSGPVKSSVPIEDAVAANGYNERYEQLKLRRAKEREKAIAEGQMADPNQPTSLNQAITPVGTCTSMCPEFERVERIVQKMVDKSEKNLETKMLKRFRRSAAGYDEQLPSDIRTPKTLLQTMNYLIRHVLGGTEPLGLIHKFVWDRTRSIRNDLSVQQLTQETHVRMAVTCLERIARFHIVSLHLLSSPANEEPFDRHQEREQLNNTMLSLMYYYDDNRGRILFPNEDEFRAYYIIFSIHDQRPDLEARVQKWPAELRNSPRVQLALELLAAAGNTWEYQGTLDAKRPNAIAQGFYARFFSLVDSPAVSYLTACVAEIYFNHVRQTAIRSIWRGYCRSPTSQQHKNEEWTVDELKTVLYFDDNEQTIKFCEEQELQFSENANGDLYLNWGTRPIDSVAFQPSSDHSFSKEFVESKRAGRTLVAIILGLNIKEAAQLGMIDSSILQERPLALPAPQEGTSTDDEALFVSDDDNEIPRTTLQANNIPQDNRDSPFSTGSPANTIGDSSQTTDTTKPNYAGGLFSQASNNLQPSEGMKASSTPFSFATPNPFAGLSSPSPFAKTLEKSNTGPLFPVSQSGFSNNNTPNFLTVSAPTFQLPNTSTLFQPSASPSTSPFNISTASLTASQPSSNIFATTNPLVPSGTPSTVFNFSTPNTAISHDSQSSTMSSTSQRTSKDGGLFNVIPDNISEPPKFSFTRPTIDMSGPALDKQQNATVESDVFSKDPISALENPLGHTDTSVKEHKSSQGKSTVADATAPPAPTLFESSEDVDDASILPIQPATDKESSNDLDGRRHAWMSMLKEAANKRRRTSSTSRKRVYEEQEEAPIETGSKVPKVADPEKLVPKKKSMALSSIKPLPKLPILEQVESMMRKPATEKKAEPPRPNQIDEDELLLSAARIAAESLRSGPKLVDNWSTRPSEPRRSSFSPENSFSSSLSFSRSQSPQSSLASGYDLALAPDTDLGLGRTLSRTEQRLRLTGGKGLAYKPLDFTPKKQRKSR